MSDVGTFETCRPVLPMFVQGKTGTDWRRVKVALLTQLRH